MIRRHYCASFRPLRLSQSGWGLLLVLATAASAQERSPSMVDPESIVRSALDHSLALKSSQSEIDKAQARVSQAKALARPSVDLDGHALRYEGIEDSQITPGIAFPAVSDRFSISLSVTQPLYTGGQLTQRRRAAQSETASAESSQQTVAFDLHLDALTAYWNWSKAHYALEALQSGVDRMAGHATDMGNLREAGLVTDSDLLATEVLLEKIRLRLEEAHRSVNLARAHIAFLTGTELPGDATPMRASPEPGPAIPSETELLDAAIAHRPELAACKSEFDAAEAQIKAQKGAMRPQIHLVAGYEMAAPNANFFPLDNVWDDDAFAGVSLTWDVFNSGLNRAKVREAVAAAQQVGFQLQHAEDMTTWEIRAARITLQNAFDRIPVAERALASAEKNMQSATILWQNGLAQHAEVLDAHAGVTDAQYDLEVTRADVLLAQAALDRAQGLLLSPPPSEASS